MHFFTSVTNNYIPKARILAKTVKENCPGSFFHLVLSDKVPDNFKLEEEPFDNLITIEQLNLPVKNLKMWIFMHNVVEICTAVKGQAILEIFEFEDADKVIYLDPDIVVLHPLDELERLLDEHSVVLTPHQLVPEKDWIAIKDNEQLFLKRGVFNLGFLALRRNQTGTEFATWWRDRLLNYCHIDEANGLFVDQKWVDLAITLFDDIYILRDKTYNVATWNLTHREVVSRKVNGVDKLFIDDSPVKFFHFSGIDSGAQESVLRKYATHMTSLWKLRDWYLKQQEIEGQSTFGKMVWAYDCFSNGEHIHDLQRVALQVRTDVYEHFINTDPFIVSNTSYCYYAWYRDEHGAQQPSKYSNFSKDELIRMLEQTKRELQLLESSESWRYTKPLRELGIIIKKFLLRLRQIYTRIA